jgi:hypothetical protein
MGTQPQTDSTANVRLEQPHPAAPVIDPAQFWSKDTEVRAKLTLGPTSDELMMKPLWGTSGTPRANEITPIDGRDERFPSRLNPNDSGYIVDIKPDRDSINPKDCMAPNDQLFTPKDSPPQDPQKEADKRDSDRMMDALRKGNLDDLKSLVGDMTPAKLKRVTEQLKAEGFDIQCVKDGKLVVFNKDLGLGVSVGQDGKAEVVKKDKDGNIVPSTDGLDPEKLLKNFSTQMPPEKTDIKELEKAFEDWEKKHPDTWTHDIFYNFVSPKRDPLIYEHSRLGNRIEQ